MKNFNLIQPGDENLMLGYWQWDIAANKLICSNNLYKIFGLSNKKDNLDFEFYFSFVHPDDREYVMQLVEKAMFEKQFYNFFHRIISKDNKIKKIHFRGEVFTDDRGEVNQMIGSCQDVTNQRIGDDRFRSLLETAPDAMIITDKNGVIQLVNKQAEILFGYTKVELTGREIELLIPERFAKNHHKYRKEFNAKMQTRMMGTGNELFGLRKDGKEISVEISLSPIETEEGVLVSAAIRDVSYRLEAEKRINQLAKIIETSGDAIISKKTDGTVITWNRGAERILGYTSTEIIGKNLSIIIPPELIIEENKIMERILKGEHIEHYETVRIRKDQRKINVSITLSSITDQEGRLIAVSKILRDITQQKRYEIELLESNERNRIFVEQSPNALAMFDNEMKYMAASKKWISDYHLEGKVIIGHSHYKISPEIKDAWKTIHQEGLNGIANRCDEEYFKGADGTGQWITWDVRPWYISEGKIGGILIYTAIITQLKEKEIEKRRIEEILNKTNEVARIGTWEVNVISGKITWSKVTKEIHEVPMDFEPDLNVALNFFREGESKEKIQRAVLDAIEKGTHYDLELELVTAKGNMVWVRAIGQSDFENGKCCRLYGILQDINERKKNEQTIQEERILLKTIIDNLPLNVYIKDLNSCKTMVNRSELEYMGKYLSEEDIIGKNDFELSPYESAILSIEEDREVINTGMPMEAKEAFHLKTDGTGAWFISTKIPLKNKNGEVTGLLGISYDITKRRENEEKLKDSQQQFEAFMANLPAMAWIVDEEGTFQYVNPLGNIIFNQYELTGKNYFDLFTEEVAKESLETNHIVLKTNATIETIQEAKRSNGELIVMKIFKFPLVISGGVKKIGAIGLDITEMVNAEESLKKLNSKLETSNKELEQFAFVASHDLKEPLRMVGSFLQLLNKKYGELLDEKALQYINFAVDGAERMNILINELLNFSKIGSESRKIERIDLNELMIKIVSIFQPTIDESNAKLIIQELPEIVANRSQMEQLIQNLLGNALKYKNKNIPRIKIGGKERKKDWLFFVKDNGIGIDLKFGEKIFVIFQRLHNKSEYSGTGIGLAICKKIVEQHGGEIWIESKPGKGSTFYFTIPKQQN